MENIIDYYWQENKGMFVKLQDGQDYFVWVGFKDDEDIELGLVINNELYDKEHNADDFWFILEKLWNYDTTRYLKRKIEENFIANGFQIIKGEVNYES